MTWRWGVYFGSWWMFQYALDRTFSLGIHIDPMRRCSGTDAAHGPYVDLHLIACALSFGRHPARAWNDSLMRVYHR